MLGVSDLLLRLVILAVQLIIVVIERIFNMERGQSPQVQAEKLMKAL